MDCDGGAERAGRADLRTADFEYHLPPERIAQRPVEPRDSSRLLVVHRKTGEIEHRSFRDLTAYLQPGDLLVANDSRVLPARLWTRKPTGGRVELLFLRQLNGDVWEALARPANRLRPGVTLTLEGSDETVTTGERSEAGGVLIQFNEPAGPVLARHGVLPLPPYIHAPLGDPERYQTVYSKIAGSAAAPTAGLHFTPQLLETLSQHGVQCAFVTLHVGLDTFRPVQAERILDHQMHSELVSVPEETARAVARAKRAGRRVVAVGTTVVRSLEAWTAHVLGDAGAPLLSSDAAWPGNGVSEPEWPSWSGWTKLFISPGYRFRTVDALITNFHLPRSTLLMLVSAFAGQALVQRVYAEAINREYRFFSFGDASLYL